MKRLFSLIAMTLMAGALFAGAIDGKWRAESKMPQGKSGKRGGASTTVLDLKSEGNALTGSISMGRGKRDRTAEIRNGKIEGAKFSFTTAMQTKKGETKLVWEGTVNGDELKGARMREGRKRGQEFSAKRL